MLASFKAWWASSKYAVWALLGIVAMILGFVLRGLFTSPHDNAPASVEPPEALKKRMDKAQDDALAARAESKARTEEQKKAVDTIMKEPEGPARRKRLAQWLANQ